MKQSLRAAKPALLVLALATPVLRAHAQAIPSAIQGFQLTAFGGATGTYTGLDGGKNLGITAGINLGLRPFFRLQLQPSIEIRGTYPVDKGNIDDQKNVLGGLKIAKAYGRYHPYVDLFYGRGAVDYAEPGYPNLSGTYFYLETPSNIFSPGAGLDLGLTDHFSLKGDIQYQRYNTPVTVSGHIYATPITAAVIYRFDFNHHYKRSRR